MNWWAGKKRPTPSLWICFTEEPENRSDAVEFQPGFPLLCSQMRADWKNKRSVPPYCCNVRLQTGNFLRQICAFSWQFWMCKGTMAVFYCSTQNLLVAGTNYGRSMHKKESLHIEIWPWRAGIIYARFALLYKPFLENTSYLTPWGHYQSFAGQFLERLKDHIIEPHESTI